MMLSRRDFLSVAGSFAGAAVATGGFTINDGGFAARGLVPCVLVLPAMIVGAIYAMIHCDGCDENVLGYPLMALVGAVMTLFSFGQVVIGADGKLVSAWPAILGVALVIYLSGLAVYLTLDDKELRGWWLPYKNQVEK